MITLVPAGSSSSPLSPRRPPPTTFHTNHPSVSRVPDTSSLRVCYSLEAEKKIALQRAIQPFYLPQRLEELNTCSPTELLKKQPADVIPGSNDGGVRLYLLRVPYRRVTTASGGTLPACLSLPPPITSVKGVYTHPKSIGLYSTLIDPVANLRHLQCVAAACLAQEEKYTAPWPEVEKTKTKTKTD